MKLGILQFLFSEKKKNENLVSVPVFDRVFIDEGKLIGVHFRSGVHSVIKEIGKE